jgi:hypothetical protein
VATSTTAFVFQQGIERQGHIPAGALQIAGVDARFGPVAVRLQSQVAGTAPGAIGGELRDAGGDYPVSFSVRALPTPVVDFIAEAIRHGRGIGPA